MRFMKNIELGGENKLYIDNPIFVGGIRRSGTTLIRSRICSHKKIIGGPETFWFETDYRRKFGRNKISLKKHLQNMLNLYSINDKQFLEKIVKLKSKKQLLNEFFFKILYREKSKTRWLEKTTINTFHMDYIFKNWKNAKFIYVYRNPIDIYLSLLKSKTKVNIKHLEQEIVDHYKFFNKHYLKNKEKIFIVSYEKFIQHHTKVLNKIFKFLKEDPKLKNKEYLKDKSYEIVKKEFNHHSHSLQNIKKPVFANKRNLVITKKQKNSIEFLKRQIKKKFKLYSKFCDINLWEL